MAWIGRRRSRGRGALSEGADSAGMEGWVWSWVAKLRNRACAEVPAASPPPGTVLLRYKQVWVRRK